MRPLSLDPGVVLLVVVGTILIGLISIRSEKSTWQRLLLIGMFSGVCFYSGVGAAYPEVPRYYLLYYFGFLCAFAYSFWLFKAAFMRVGTSSGRILSRAFDNVDWHPAWLLVMWLYILLHFAPLLYPEPRLENLFAPPQPDLLTRLYMRWQIKRVDVLLKLVDYARVLVTPFFYIALFRFRQRLSRVLLIFALVLYLRFVAESYLSRSSVVIALGTVWLAVWVVRPERRRFLVAVGCFAFLLALGLSYYYGLLRLGVRPAGLRFLDALLLMLENEFSFPRDVGVPIIESGVQVDLVNYMKWLLTLPIPKLLTGEIEGARVNYEISEFILGVPRGAGRFYIVLPGLVAEAVYIFGRYFFWLHAVFIALLAALLMRLMEGVPQLLFLQAYVVVTFAYHLNRGGIVGPMGIFVNHFLLFYLFVLVRASGLLPIRHSQARVAVT